MSKRKLLSIALVVIMIAILSFSSLAWFTDSGSVQNDFTIGGAGMGDGGEKIFSIDVLENVDGEKEPVEGMKFEDVLPGDNFKKEAYIENTGSYDQYIRVTMTISDWALINRAVCGNNANGIVKIKLDDKFNDNWHIAGQIQVKDGYMVVNTNGCYDAETDTLTVTMYLNKKLESGETVDIMDYVSISAEATQEDFAAEAFADGFLIKIHADAVQTENILDAYAAEEWQNAKATFDKLA